MAHSGPMYRRADNVLERHRRGSIRPETALRAQVQSAADVLRSATITNAELLQQTDRLGVLRPDSFADLLLANGDLSRICDS
jgi:imidazolonepropionase-like amidohydrolase